MESQEKSNSIIELVALLGNPGREYEHTRHNAPWHLGAQLPFRHLLSWQGKFKGLYADLDSSQLQAYLPETSAPIGAARADSALAESTLAESAPAEAVPAVLPRRLHFIMPETYMNKVGESIQAVASFYKIPPQRILLVQDELEIPLGCLSLKFSGGLGGHNGLRSMVASCGTPDFWRLRIGIGRPDHPDIYGWVLSAFTPEERERLEPVLEAGSALLIRALLGDPNALLPEWKKKLVE